MPFPNDVHLNLWQRPQPLIRFGPNRSATCLHHCRRPGHPDLRSGLPGLVSRAVRPMSETPNPGALAEDWPFSSGGSTKFPTRCFDLALFKGPYCSLAIEVGIILPGLS